LGKRGTGIYQGGDAFGVGGTRDAAKGENENNRSKENVGGLSKVQDENELNGEEIGDPGW